MGILFLPGSAGQPAHVEASTVQSSSSSAAGEDPSPRKVATARGVATVSYQVTLTAYNAVPSQTDSDPSVTASGAHSNPHIIAARSQDLADELPFGTVVMLTRVADDSPSCRFHDVEEFIGYRVIADTMNARFENRMDVELDPAAKIPVEGRSVSAGIALGVCGKVKATVVGHVPVSRIPNTQAELAKLFAPQELALNR